MPHFAIARTDSIGDVMLTLPMAGVLKKQFPGAAVSFIGKSYTQDIVNCCKHVDHFINWDELKIDKNRVGCIKKMKIDCVLFALPNLELSSIVFRAGVPKRIGVSRRWFHWVFCNYRPAFSRRKSLLHEAQLNLKLLKSLVQHVDFSLNEIIEFYGFSPTETISKKFDNLLATSRPNLIIHPKSQGSAREWGLSNFLNFAKIAVKKGARVFVTGTEEEGLLIRPHFSFSNNVIDLTGKMTLSELVAFINNCDGLVAASTGPLHIAAALNLKAVGLYSTLRPINPARWAPLGKKSVALTYEGAIDPNLKIKDDTTLELISPSRVLDCFEELF